MTLEDADPTTDCTVVNKDLSIELLGEVNEVISFQGNLVWMGTGVIIPESVHVILFDASDASDDFHVVDWDKIMNDTAGVVGDASVEGSFETVYVFLATGVAHKIRIGHDDNGQVLLANSNTAAFNLPHLSIERMLAPVVCDPAGGGGVGSGGFSLLGEDDITWANANVSVLTTIDLPATGIHAIRLQQAHAGQNNYDQIFLFDAAAVTAFVTEYGDGTNYANTLGVASSIAFRGVVTPAELFTFALLKGTGGKISVGLSIDSGQDSKISLYSISGGGSSDSGSGSGSAGSSLGDLWATSDALPTTAYTVGTNVFPTWTISDDAPDGVTGTSVQSLAGIPRVPPNNSLVGFWVTGKVDGTEATRIFFPWGVLNQVSRLYFGDGATKYINVSVQTGTTGNDISIGLVAINGTVLPSNSTVEVHAALAGGSSSDSGSGSGDSGGAPAGYTQTDTQLVTWGPSNHSPVTTTVDIPEDGIHYINLKQTQGNLGPFDVFIPFNAAALRLLTPIVSQAFQQYWNFGFLEGRNTSTLRRLLVSRSSDNKFVLGFEYQNPRTSQFSIWSLSGGGGSSSPASSIPELTRTQAENSRDLTFGTLSGERLAQAIAANLNPDLIKQVAKLPIYSATAPDIVFLTDPYTEGNREDMVMIPAPGPVEDLFGASDGRFILQFGTFSKPSPITLLQCFGTRNNYRIDSIFSYNEDFIDRFTTLVVGRTSTVNNVEVITTTTYDLGEKLEESGAFFKRVTDGPDNLSDTSLRINLRDAENNNYFTDGSVLVHEVGFYQKSVDAEAYIPYITFGTVHIPLDGEPTTNPKQPYVVGINQLGRLWGGTSKSIVNTTPNQFASENFVDGFYVLNAESASDLTLDGQFTIGANGLFFQRKGINDNTAVFDYVTTENPWRTVWDYIYQNVHGGNNADVLALRDESVYLGRYFTEDEVIIARAGYTNSDYSYYYAQRRSGFPKHEIKKITTFVLGMRTVHNVFGWKGPYLDAEDVFALIENDPLIFLSTRQRHEINRANSFEALLNDMHLVRLPSAVAHTQVEDSLFLRETIPGPADALALVTAGGATSIEHASTNTDLVFGFIAGIDDSVFDYTVQLRLEGQTIDNPEQYWTGNFGFAEVPIDSPTHTTYWHTIAIPSNIEGTLYLVKRTLTPKLTAYTGETTTPYRVTQLPIKVIAGREVYLTQVHDTNQPGKYVGNVTGTAWQRVYQPLYSQPFVGSAGIEADNVNTVMNFGANQKQFSLNYTRKHAGSKVKVKLNIEFRGHDSSGKSRAGVRYWITYNGPAEGADVGLKSQTHQEIEHTGSTIARFSAPAEIEVEHTPEAGETTYSVYGNSLGDSGTAIAMSLHSYKMEIMEYIP